MSEGKVDLFRLDKIGMKYLHFPEVDYAELLATCAPEALAEQRGSIFPEGPLPPAIAINMDKLDLSAGLKY